MTADEDFPHPPRLTLPPRGGIPPAPVAGSLTIVDIASSGEAVAAWLQGAGAAAIAVDVVTLARLDPAPWWQGRHAVFERLAAGRFVGWRLAIAGPEYAVLALQAVALQSGLLPGEVLVCSDSDPHRMIYCPHCATVSGVDARQPVACAGCRRPLFVHDHFNAAAGYFLASVTGAP